MKFPRKSDGSLDFDAFYKLPKDQAEHAVLDLKQNGTVLEKQAFRSKIAQRQLERDTLKTELLLEKATLQEGLRSDKLELQALELERRRLEQERSEAQARIVGRVNQAVNTVSHLKSPVAVLNK